MVVARMTAVEAEPAIQRCLDADRDGRRVDEDGTADRRGAHGLHELGDAIDVDAHRQVLRRLGALPKAQRRGRAVHDARRLAELGERLVQRGSDRLGVGEIDTAEVAVRIVEQVSRRWDDVDQAHEA